MKPADTASATSNRPLLPGADSASLNGFFDVVPADFIFWNTGLSDNFIRTQIEMPSSSSDTRNGTRQPQAANSASGIIALVASTTARVNMKPPAAAAWIQLV